MSGSRRRLLHPGVGQLRLEGQMDIRTCRAKLANTMLHLGILALPNTHVHQVNYALNPEPITSRCKTHMNQTQHYAKSLMNQTQLIGVKTT
jgi:hypothetical protein